MDEEILIIGCGGQGRVILDILNSQKRKVIGFIDDDPKKADSLINNTKVIGNIHYLLEKKPAMNIAIGVGDNKTRAKIFSLLKEKKFRIIQTIHSKAVISKNVKLGEGVVIMPGAIINTNAVIEDNVIINTNSSIDHDCIIKKNSHIQPGATVTGTVTIGEFATIGSGATVLPNLKIGSNSVIGAGAVVTKDIPDDVVVFGVPAKQAKDLKDEK